MLHARRSGFNYENVVHQSDIGSHSSLVETAAYANTSRVVQVYGVVVVFGAVAVVVINGINSIEGVKVVEQVVAEYVFGTNRSIRRRNVQAVNRTIGCARKGIAGVVNAVFRNLRGNSATSYRNTIENSYRSP